MKKTIRLGWLSFLIIGIIGVSVSSAKDIQVSLLEKKIQDLHPGGLNLVFYVQISNSSSKDYYLSGYHFTFVVNETEYLRLNRKLDKGMKVEHQDETLISLPVKITYKHLFRTVEEVKGQTKASCYLRGGLHLSKHREKSGKPFPMVFSAEFPILDEPEIEPISLRVNEMTFAGADIDIEIKLKNGNPFELLVDRISYHIEVGNVSLDKGRIRGNKNIKAAGEKDISLPLLVNFFEVGQKLKAVLQQDTAVCRITGEIESRTVWGKVVFLFDKRERIPVNKT
ncbi:LEA type 2 family protein [bacterium]|nr:LEA type 2 family protein [bacterium]